MWVWRGFPAIKPWTTMARAWKGSSWDPHEFSAPVRLPLNQAKATGCPHAQVPCISCSQKKEREKWKNRLTFSRVLDKFFVFTCGMLPRMGKGAGPGGIFPFPDLPLHDAKESRQAMQTRRTTVAAPRISICFCTREGVTGCRSTGLYTEGLS